MYCNYCFCKNCPYGLSCTQCNDELNGHLLINEGCNGKYETDSCMLEQITPEYAEKLRSIIRAKDREAMELFFDFEKGDWYSEARQRREQLRNVQSEHGETRKHKTKDLIYMKVEVIFGLKESISSKIQFTEHIDLVDFGGHTFKIDGKKVPFDFEAWSSECELLTADKVKIKLETGDGGLIKCDTIDLETYKDCYRELGIEPTEITAQMLASAEQILEFNICLLPKDDWDNEVVSMEITGISFYDGKETYPVSSEVIEGYLKALYKEEI